MLNQKSRYEFFDTNNIKASYHFLNISYFRHVHVIFKIRNICTCSFYFHRTFEKAET